MRLSTMRLSPSPLLLTLLPLADSAARSSKRGLVFIPKEETPEDNGVWVQKGTDLTWYYNYHDRVSPAFAGVDQSKFEFVPMMWGVPDKSDGDTAFRDNVQTLIKEQGVDIKHVMGFNEPDEKQKNGGSDIKPKDAAEAWIKNMVPLREMGIKVGLPAVTGSPRGLEWLKDFMDECKKELDEDDKECEFDFVPVHWYGPFESMTGHIGERLVDYPKKPIWVTEFGFPFQDLPTTQQFYNQSTSWLDNSDFIERYAYFGSFRSHTSNVGPNVPFLNNDGLLTDIGSWYLGGNETGVDPQSGNEAKGLRAPLLVALAAIGVSILLV